ncbi:uncharacterized protein LOC134250652 isoform X2 [Saccostrea cucullata]
MSSPSQISPQIEQRVSTKTKYHCDSDTADKTVTGTNLHKPSDVETVPKVPVSEPSAADTFCANTLSHIDFLGEFNDLSSVYALTELPLQPKDQPFNVVMDGSSLYLVGLQNQVYVSMVQQPSSSDGQVFCTVEHNTHSDLFHQHGDNIDCLYYATMDVDRREAHDHQLTFPSRKSEWSEQVKYSHDWHECEWGPLEYHEANYSKFGF